VNGNDSDANTITTTAVEVANKLLKEMSDLLGNADSNLVQHAVFTSQVYQNQSSSNYDDSSVNSTRQ
jgi:hypothetical protein